MKTVSSTVNDSAFTMQIQIYWEVEKEKEWPLLPSFCTILFHFGKFLQGFSLQFNVCIHTVWHLALPLALKTHCLHNCLLLALISLIRVENFPAVGHLECPVPSWITLKPFAQNPFHTLYHQISFQQQVIHFQGPQYLATSDIKSLGISLGQH